MIIIIIIIGILIYFFLIKPFLRQKEAIANASYLSVPDEVKYLIANEKVIELSELLVKLELEKEYSTARLIIDAIEIKGFSFSRRVDKVRNEMRIEAGLGPLKHF
jgi:preprotein translocase subunit YajC